MAILGTLIDKQTISVVGSAVDSMALKTYSHSLPATNPELVLPNLRSICVLHSTAVVPTAGDGANGLPQLCGIGGNASIITVGMIAASCASVPTIMADIYAVVFHSLAR